MRWGVRIHLLRKFMKKTSIIVILVLLFIAGTNAGARGLKQALNQADPVAVEPVPESVSVPPLPKTPFTVSLRRILPDDQLNRVQFYLSNGLTNQIGKQAKHQSRFGG